VQPVVHAIEGKAFLLIYFSHARTQIRSTTTKPTPPYFRFWGLNPNPRDLTHHPPTHQPTHQPTNQPINRPTNQPTDQRTDPPTDPPTNQPTDQPTNRPTNTQRCVSMLLECGRLPEAALFARAYLPSKMSDCVKVRAFLVVLGWG